LASSVWRASDSQPKVLALFSAALVLGAAATTAILWLVGGVMSWIIPALPALIALGTFGAVAVARDAKVIRLDLPENRRLIPREVFDRRPWKAATWFGFELGTGVRTYRPSTSPYVLGLLLVLFGGSWSVVIPALLAAGFGLGRAWMIWSWRLSGIDAGWSEVLSLRLRVWRPLSTALVVGGAILMGASS
jgi:hypothetical protein